MNDWNPLNGVRLAPAWRAIITLLADDEPHKVNDILRVAREASHPMHARAIPPMLSGAVKHGLLWRGIDSTSFATTLQITADTHVRRHPAIAWVWQT